MIITQSRLLAQEVTSQAKVTHPYTLSTLEYFFSLKKRKPYTSKELISIFERQQIWKCTELYNYYSRISKCNFVELGSQNPINTIVRVNFFTAVSLEMVITKIILPMEKKIICGKVWNRVKRGKKNTVIKSNRNLTIEEQIFDNAWKLSGLSLGKGELLLLL